MSGKPTSTVAFEKRWNPMLALERTGSATFGGLGFELGYTWLLGPPQRVGISIGGGASRLFGSDLDGATLTVPTIRLVNVGIAF